MFLLEFAAGERQANQKAWNLFKDWVKTKNPEEEYCWSNPWQCAAGQFCKEKAGEVPLGIYGYISDFARPYRTFGELAKALA